MTRTRLALPALLTILLLASVHGAHAQTVERPACGFPPQALVPAPGNLFSDQQEEWLGEAMADRVESLYPLAPESENQYLQHIVDRLTRALPPSQRHFHVHLIESGAVNAFSLAGGQIYLTRKLVLSAQSEDEIAGVLAHEIGHIVSQQIALATSREMTRLLGVSSLGDRADVRTRFLQLLQAEAAKGGTPHSEQAEYLHQEEADRIAVYTTAAAGYQPQAFADLWDRSFFTAGKTGGWISDLLGTTTPNALRLRSIRKLIAALPAGCGAHDASHGETFQAWQRAALEHRGTPTAQEDTTTSTGAVPLSPPLRPDLTRLRFSRDGKYILAQDESSITVLTRSPFALQFQISAERAQPAEWTPDSQEIVFNTPALHTERWSVAAQKLVEAHEILSRDTCVTSRLAPDGRTLLCLSLEDPGVAGRLAVKLSLLDVASGSVLLQKHEFFQGNADLVALMFVDQMLNQAGTMLPLSWSLDGNTALIGAGRNKVALDLRTRTETRVGEDLTGRVDGPYAFLADNRIAGVNQQDPKRSGIFSFPEGKLITAVPILFSNLESVTGGDYALTRGARQYAIALADVAGSKFLVASKAPSLDFWKGTVASEDGDGSIVLAKLGAPATGWERLHLPMSSLGPLAAAALSGNGRFLALSSRTRGGIWDTTTGKQLIGVAGFSAASWNSDGTLYAQFPRREDLEGHIGQVTMEPLAGSNLPGTLAPDTHLTGANLLQWTKAGRNMWSLQVRRVAETHPFGAGPFHSRTSRPTATASAPPPWYSPILSPPAWQRRN